MKPPSGSGPARPSVSAPPGSALTLCRHSASFSSSGPQNVEFKNSGEPPVDLGGVDVRKRERPLSGMALSISIAPFPSRPGSRRSRTMPGENSGKGRNVKW